MSSTSSTNSKAPTTPVVEPVVATAEVKAPKEVVDMRADAPVEPATIANEVTAESKTEVKVPAEAGKTPQRRDSDPIRGTHPFDHLGNMAIALNQYFSPPAAAPATSAAAPLTPADDVEEEKEAEKQHDVEAKPSNEAMVYGGGNLGDSGCGPAGTVTNFLEKMVMGNKLAAPTTEVKEASAFEQAAGPTDEPGVIVDEVSAAAPIVDTTSAESDDSAGADSSSDEEDALVDIANTPRTAKKQAKEAKQAEKKVKKEEKAKAKELKKEQKTQRAAAKKAEKEKKAAAKKSLGVARSQSKAAAAP